MIVFFFTGVGTTALLRKELHFSHTWRRWPDTYGAVLPYVRDAFGRVVDSLKAQIPEEVRPDMLLSIRELCEPDPALRGHPFGDPGRKVRVREGELIALKGIDLDFNGPQNSGS